MTEKDERDGSRGEREIVRNIPLIEGGEGLDGGMSSETFPFNFHLTFGYKCMKFDVGFALDLKSMVAAGLATIASCNYNFMDAVSGTENMRILCIGQGGGSLPLFLASKMQGVVDVVEIDPLVISASVMWKGIHERLFLYESDAEDFLLNTTNQYDMVFVDACDGEDIFPRKLWDPHSPFLKALSSRLHPGSWHSCGEPSFRF
ncbi:hypothetical protein C1H46_004793 [Malus baccata]|uniref:PABS domain-containing protein n=1 Tax=Malus baccata TaxID=106549 RepID=A0A540NEU7_MALBA|nr:hypothetical protein C1H46_004793 [Malus baccata]